MADLVDMFEPVPDFTPPTMEQTRRMVSFIDEQTAAGKPVAVSCYAASDAPAPCWPATWYTGELLRRTQCNGSGS